MKLYLTNDEIAIVQREASIHGLTCEEVEDIVAQIYNSNFEEDVVDALRENPDWVEKCHAKRPFVYYVTDPCYLIADKDWDKMCMETDEEASRNCEQWSEIFKGKVTKLLREISGDENAVADDTGFGDWSNKLHGVTTKGAITTHSFYADSGMVCFVQATQKLLDYVKAHDNTSLYLGAVLRYPEGGVTCKMDRSNSSWTVVELYNAQGRLIAASESPEDDEEEDE